ncbi:RNA polymerase subunit sigma-70 [Blastococcus sp. TBT05-19]|uniref:sigma-70 family RNA polymerase sigma factor n=1 Tax=Blastococcus sp. TBT05-19 TaxID=2250581 RepID=UPI000DE99A65|nr:sigma-70 family RNA polymerase sigma factor [Blastococcus sp. TBT05-19]RBY91533.1 RNA polymerase subunit sigma-70 [Blastococcus sp. TBT05-19]
MPHPLDAGRPAGLPTPRRPRPTPFPRTSAEGLDAGTAEHGTDEHPVNEPGGDPVAVEAAPTSDGVPTEVPATSELPSEVAEEIAAAEAEASAGATDVWALVREAQQGDAEAFGRLYDHYVTLVHRYAYHRVGDRATAEDVTSETFVRALRRIDSLSFQGRDVGAWLVTIARNIIRDQVKSSRFRLEVSTADMRDADRVTDGPEDAVLQYLTNQQLLACVQQLGSEQQECIVLRFLHGLSVSETAEIMGKKDGAIKALQHRAVRRLAAMLPEGLR